MIEIKKLNNGNFQLDFKSTAGNSLLKSIPFPTEIEAKRVMNHAKSNPIFERKTTHSGEFVIALKTKTGQSIGVSSGYSSEAGMENDIINLKKSLGTINEM